MFITRDWVGRRVTLQQVPEGTLGTSHFLRSTILESVTNESIGFTVDIETLVCPEEGVGAMLCYGVHLSRAGGSCETSIIVNNFGHVYNGHDPLAGMEHVFGPGENIEAGDVLEFHVHREGRGGVTVRKNFGPSISLRTSHLLPFAAGSNRDRVFISAYAYAHVNSGVTVPPPDLLSQIRLL